jgi:hypothetical protein
LASRRERKGARARARMWSRSEGGSGFVGILLPVCRVCAAVENPGAAVGRELLNFLCAGVGLGFDQIAHGLVGDLKLVHDFSRHSVAVFFLEAQGRLVLSFDRFAFGSYLFHVGHMICHTLKVMSRMGVIGQNFSYVTEC